jgi:hypothetical protein
MRQRYYVKNYCYFWSLTRAEYLKLIEQGMTGKPWDVNDYGKQLKKAPHCSKRVIEPLDWTAEDWRYELEQLEA